MANLNHGLFFAGIGDNCFQLCRYWIFNPGFSALLTDECGNFADHDNAGLHVDAERGMPFLFFSSTKWAVAIPLFHDFFLLVFKSGSK